ncbi:DNA alkylation repair protein [Fulvivirgaceae bacterium BMA12]|uniref:DNA alkylation repair protein n=1 Tax=Agaribacillus aureus TaxID=3051825 RepID=A0ABT8LI42_9BACT|nr:DNA alkylation repair protein [Fulvivirgaceae bacterium BMA12]
MNADQFINKLSTCKSDKELGKVDKFFKGNDGVTKPFGVKFGDVFNTAKEFIDMPLDEINKLLDSEFYEVRMGAVSIMDFQAKRKKTPEERKKQLFDLYLSRHDRLNNWDFVDRGSYNIIGEFLMDKPRDILYELAKSSDPWERRTAIVSTYAFIKEGDLNDTFNIAGLLIHDEHELINKAVGSWIREAGKKDESRLKEFLDKYAASMPRVTLRYAVEKLDKKTKAYYMNLGK